MSQFYLIRFLKIILSLVFFGVLCYNFHIANELKYEAEGDAADFISLGASLAKKQKYGHLKIPGGTIRAIKEEKISAGDYDFAGHSTWRPPVWPLFVASVFFLFGYNLTYLLIFKFALHLFGTFIFYRILKLLKIRDIFIVIGAFLYGISPAWQLYSRVFLSEPITLFLITLWLFFLLRFIIKKKSFLFQAITGGILILAHPYYIFLPFVVWMVLLVNRQLNWKVFFLSSAICAAVVSIWIIRNFVVLETKQVIITTSSGVVMAKGWNPEVSQQHTNTQGDLADEELVLESYPNHNKNSGLNEVQRLKLYKDATKYFIKNNRHQILPIIGAKIKSAFNPLPETPRPGSLETGRVIFQLLSFLSIFYIIFFTRNRLIWSLAIGLIISTLGITILTYSGFRFRMPQSVIEILFIIFFLNKFKYGRIGNKEEIKPQTQIKR